MNKHCESHTEYGRHLSDSLCPYAENETAPALDMLDAFDRLVAGANQEIESLMDMHSTDPDGDYKVSADSLDAALGKADEMRRLLVAAPELIGAVKELVACLKEALSMPDPNTIDTIRWEHIIVKAEARFHE